MGQNISSLEYGNSRDPCAYTNVEFSKTQLIINFEKKNWFFLLRNFRFDSCASKGYDIVKTPYYPCFAPLFVKWLPTRG